MDELLKSIKTEVQDGLSYVRAGDVYITPHVNARPKGVREPCVGIKDGKVTHKYLSGGAMEYTMAVKLSFFVSLSKQEASMIGDPSTGDKGILQVNKDLIEILDENDLGIPGIISCEIKDDSESILYITKDKKEIQRKELSLIYIKQTG